VREVRHLSNILVSVCTPNSNAVDKAARYLVLEKAPHILEHQTRSMHGMGGGAQVTKQESVSSTELCRDNDV
jgi:hypothetical protein